VVLGAVAQAPKKSVSPKQLAAKKRRPGQKWAGQIKILWGTQAFFKIRFSSCEAPQSS
jgi:hypothetical protein